MPPPRATLEEALLQATFGGCGGLVLAFVTCRDVVQGLAATNKTLAAHLKAHYLVVRDDVRPWHRMSACGWQRCNKVLLGLDKTFPALHVKELDTSDELLIGTNAPVGEFIHCPQLQRVFLDASPWQRRARVRKVRRLMARKRKLTRGKANELELWHHVAARTAWRVIAPRLTQLTLYAYEGRSGNPVESDMNVTGLMMSAVFSRANLPPLQRLDLRLTLPNGDVAVHIMSTLAISLRSLKAFVMVPTSEDPTPAWLWEVSHWPVLEELCVSWTYPTIGCQPVRPREQKRLHAPVLHTLELELGTSMDVFASITPETLLSLRNVSLQLVADDAKGRSLEVDLGRLPDAVTRLTLRIWNAASVVWRSLPVGLRELVVVGGDFVCRRAERGALGLIELPQLRVLEAAPGVFAMIHAPTLREVVWGDGSALHKNVIVSRELSGLLLGIRHVTYCGTCVPLSFRAWITRVEFTSDSVGEEERASWLACARLRALHFPDPRSEVEITELRTWAHQHGYAFWVRACSQDDDDDD